MLIGLIVAFGVTLPLTPAFAEEWKSFAIEHLIPYPDEKTAEKNMAVGIAEGANEEKATAAALSECKKRDGEDCSVVKSVPKNQYLVIARCAKDGQYIFSVGTSDFNLRGAVENAGENAGFEYGAGCIVRFQWLPDHMWPDEKNRPLGIETSSATKWKTVVASYTSAPSYFFTLAIVTFGKGDNDLASQTDTVLRCFRSVLGDCDDAKSVPEDWYLVVASCHKDNVSTYSLGISEKSVGEALRDAKENSSDPEGNKCSVYWDWSPENKWPIQKITVSNMLIAENPENIPLRFPPSDNE